MNQSFVCCLLIPAIFSLLIPVPGTAASQDILLFREGSMMDWADAHIDNNLIATFVSSSSPPAIKIFYSNGSFYKAIPLSRETIRLDSLEISGGLVYYTEYDTAESSYLRNETVFEFDLSKGEKKVIYMTNGPQQRITKIAADGDNIVFRGGSNDQILILYNRSSKTSGIIFTSFSMIHGLAIDGGRILWGCERTDKEPGREIHVYTISTANDSIIPESKSIRTWGYGDISGDRVVWNMAAGEPDTSLGYPSLVNAGGDIRLTDLSTGKTQSIEILNTPETPFISGDSIVYLKKPEIDYNNTDAGTIRVYDISTGSFSDIASGVAGISGFDNGFVLWNKLKPMTFWVTPVSGKSTATGSSATTAETVIQMPAMQNTPPPESPVGTIVIVLAVTVGIVVYTTLKRKASD